MYVGLSAGLLRHSRLQHNNYTVLGFGEDEGDDIARTSTSGARRTCGCDLMSNVLTVNTSCQAVGSQFPGLLFSYKTLDRSSTAIL
jgi:hypothetical protein